MTNPSLLILLGLVIVLATFLGVTIYEYINRTSLSLPTSPVLTALTIFLLIFAAADTTFAYRLRGCRAGNNNNSPLGSFFSALLQGAQAILTVVLATLRATSLVPSSSPALRCELETAWQRLYVAHDGAAIRHVQDALDCCGLNSVIDRAWPFGHPSTCPASFGRTAPCRAGWTSALQRSAGFDLAVAVSVGVFQIISLLIMSNIDWQELRWMPSGSVSYGEPSDARQPLLLSPEVQRINEEAGGQDSEEQDAGHGGQDAGHGGQDAGHGGQDAGHGGQDAGHGGQDAGHGGRDASGSGTPMELSTVGRGRISRATHISDTGHKLPTTNPRITPHQNHLSYGSTLS